MKKIEPKYIIIEKPTLREAIREMIKKRIRPLTIEEIWNLKKEGKINNQWYGSGTLWYNGKFQRITFEQMRNIEEIYEEGGCLLHLGHDGNVGLLGYLNLYLVRFVWVKKVKQ